MYFNISQPLQYVPSPGWRLSEREGLSKVYSREKKIIGKAFLDQLGVLANMK